MALMQNTQDPSLQRNKNQVWIDFRSTQDWLILSLELSFLTHDGSLHKSANATLAADKSTY